MNLTHAIKDIATISRLKDEYKKGGTRDYMLFLVGLNTGLRISDIIDLKVSDVRKKLRDEIVDVIDVVEKKTGKRRLVELVPELKAELKAYTENMKKDAYLFPSQKGGFITRVQANRILNAGASKLGIEDFGCHGMRKTFGFWHYQANKNVAILQEIFNHSSPQITRTYIDLGQDEIRASMKGFFL